AHRVADAVIAEVGVAEVFHRTRPVAAEQRAGDVAGGDPAEHAVAGDRVDLRVRGHLYKSAARAVTHVRAQRHGRDLLVGNLLHRREALAEPAGVDVLVREGVAHAVTAVVVDRGRRAL